MKQEWSSAVVVKYHMHEHMDIQMANIGVLIDLLEIIYGEVRKKLKYLVRKGAKGKDGPRFLHKRWIWWQAASRLTVWNVVDVPVR